MKFLKFFLITTAVIVLAFIVPKFFHFTYTVNTWDGWSSQLLGEDLSKKYNAFAVGFDHNAIRSDFVKQYNALIVEDILNKYLDGAKSTEKMPQELMRLKMIGVWSDGDNIIFKNDFLIVDDKLGIDEFAESREFFKKYLDIKNNRQSMSDKEYCIYGTINTHFKNFILIGPNNKTATIPLCFTLKEEFK